jgi:hypothetical protein
MKKKICLICVGLVVFFAFSCKSAPKATASIDDGLSAEEKARKIITEAFDSVYGKYFGDLILEGATNYTVVKGDTLSQIASSKFGKGNGYYFPVIMLASHETVEDPDIIEIGDKLTIPDLQKNLDNPRARTNIKEYLKEIAELYGQQKGQEAIKNDLIKLSDSI